MKLKLLVRTSLLSGILCMAAAACESDMEKVYLGPQEDVTLSGGSSDVILSPATPDALALTLYWNGDGRLVLSDSLLQAPVNASDIAIELSRSADFAAPTVINLEPTTRYYQLRSKDLNNILGLMGYDGTSAEPLYIRIRTTLAANQPPRYSNVMSLRVKNFVVHLDLATVLNKDGSETAMRLASPTENGIYTGFMGVSSWFNWWLKEGNGITWGNLGVAGKEFFADSESDHWNFWFPEPAGCYFTTVNTLERWWSALYVSGLSVSGDISGSMTYNRTSNRWTLTLPAGKSGPVSFRISGKGSLYDKLSGTDPARAAAKTFGFGGASDALTFGDRAAELSLDLPSGTKSLILDLSNPLKWTVAPGK